jgi:hypothetical protein
MSARVTRSEQSVLKEVADRYRNQGYLVNVHPRPSTLPEALRDFRLDMIATRGDEVVIVEVKQGKSTESIPPQLTLLADRAQVLGWRVDLVSVPEEEVAAWSRARRHELERDALELFDSGHKEAAVLLASAALEGAVRALAGRHRLHVGSPGSARQMIDGLQSQGVIGPAMGYLLAQLTEARNRTTHAMPVGHAMTSQVRGAIEAATWLDGDSFTSPDEMADRFFEEFEDPAEWVPYETAEGGYQYPGGEPHDALDVLLGMYPDAPEAALSDALALIEPLGSEWVRKR